MDAVSAACCSVGWSEDGATAVDSTGIVTDGTDILIGFALVRRSRMGACRAGTRSKDDTTAVQNARVVAHGTNIVVNIVVDLAAVRSGRIGDAGTAAIHRYGTGTDRS